MEERKERIDALLRLITNIDNEADCRALFEDLCTQKELENMAERCYAAALLLQGNTYSQVTAAANISSSVASGLPYCIFSFIVPTNKNTSC